jgi:hypothetical protein
LPGESVAQAAERARAAGSANVWMNIVTAIPGGEITMTGVGAFDMENNRGHLSFDTTGTGEAAAASEQVGSMEAVYDQFVAYLKIPALAQFMPRGKSWVKVDFEALGNKTGIDVDQLSQLGQNNPMQQLDYLRGAKDIEEVGNEDVRGIETTHYKGVVDFDALKEELPANAAGSIDRLKELTGIDRAPIDVWLDADGLPRRVSYRFDYDVPGATGTGQGSGAIALTVEFFDYGTDVTVDIPPEKEVFDPSQSQAQG